MKRKVGRPKGSNKGEPINFNFWKGILRDNQIQAFIDRGSKEQKAIIKTVLKYLKIKNREFFDTIKGNKILRELKTKL